MTKIASLVLLIFIITRMVVYVMQGLPEVIVMDKEPGIILGKP